MATFFFDFLLNLEMAHAIPGHHELSDEMMGVIVGLTPSQFASLSPYSIRRLEQIIRIDTNRRHIPNLKNIDDRQKLHYLIDRAFDQLTGRAQMYDHDQMYDPAQMHAPDQMSDHVPDPDQMHDPDQMPYQMRGDQMPCQMRGDQMFATQHRKIRAARARANRANRANQPIVQYFPECA